VALWLLLEKGLQSLSRRENKCVVLLKLCAYLLVKKLPLLIVAYDLAMPMNIQVVWINDLFVMQNNRNCGLFHQ